MIRMCLLTKGRKVLMDVMLVFFFFTNQMLCISGTMVVIRGSSASTLSASKKLICISEDDGGALVWNDYLNWEYCNQSHQSTQFDYLKGGVPNCKLNCNMNADEDCLKLWNRQNWNLTNSLKTPMGPVFDRRWEEFQEYRSFKNKYDFISLENTTALSISIRGSSDAHILLCNGQNYNDDLCYWIILGGWNNTMSVIRKCATGVPIIDKLPNEDSSCKKAQVSFEHTPLSLMEWRTFVITWNSVTRNISVYDTDNIIMTYKDAEEYKHSHIKYHMFIRNNTNTNNKIVFRFHIYNFLHTTLENTILMSPIIQLDNETICIQMLIGLCAECDAHVKLFDLSSHKVVLETVIVKGTSKATIHGLPMWQSVQIKSPSMFNYNNVRLYVISKLSSPSSNPLWAIANVRRCPTNDSLRWSKLYKYEDETFYKFENPFCYFRHSVWPAATCQKLFYDNHIVVNFTSDTKSDLIFDLVNCPKGIIGPQCLINCDLDLQGYDNCSTTLICYKDGCTCPPGFWGSNCSKPCASNTYGYGCKKKCGACRNRNLIHTQGLCDEISGICYDGCKDFYIPPLCQLKITKLNAPEITSTNTTSIQTIIPMTWKKEYEETTILYSCTLQGQVLQKNYVEKQSWKKVFPNTTQLIGYFENLAPGINYQIRCGLNVTGYQIFSDWQNAETDCNPPDGFDVKPGETNMIIDWQINKLYPCPANRYRLIVRNVDTDKQIFNESIMNFPHNLSQLTSYTLFNVTILHKSDQVFFQQIRTLESVPSSVLDLQVTISSDTLNLIWKPPDQPNGEILQYVVTLRIKEYYGCNDLQLPMPDNHKITKITKITTITISDLHPYAFYNVQVTAHNSRNSSMAVEKSFDTKSSEIPREVFSQLKVQDWKLTWRPPEDCTMISGPIKARIKIRGISDAVKNEVHENKQTSLYSFDLNKLKLHGDERYVVRIFVIRDYASLENVSAYQEYEFETPPTAPPSVINLDVIETDTHRTPTMIHLRWQSPRPPLNGKLRYYAIQSCERYNNKNCPIIKVQLNEFCDLWDDYICRIIQKPLNNPRIQVLAYNMNVTEPSSPVFVTDQMLNNTKPNAPENFTFTINNNSIIELEWQHPWRTGDHLLYFQIWIQEISSNLRRQRLTARSPHNNTMYKYPVVHYMRNYSERLYLFPSTQYQIHLKAVTVAMITSKNRYIEVYTPSTISFDGDLKVTVDKLQSMILLNIPPVVNDTHDSMMHIIVKGPNACVQHSKVPENLRSQANVKVYDIAWQAAEGSTSDLAGKSFTLGDNQTYGGARNCPLEPKELYEIVIIVMEQNSFNESIMLAKLIRIGEVRPKYYEMGVVLIILFLVIIGASYYFIQRKRQKSTLEHVYEEINFMENIKNSGQETKSVISNSKQVLATSFSKKSSRAIAPEVLFQPQEEKRENGEENDNIVKNEIFLNINFNFYQD